MKVLQRTAAAARAFGSVGERWGLSGRRGCDGRAAALSCSSVTVAVVAGGDYDDHHDNGHFHRHSRNALAISIIMASSPQCNTAATSKRTSIAQVDIKLFPADAADPAQTYQHSSPPPPPHAQQQCTFVGRQSRAARAFGSEGTA